MQRLTVVALGLFASCISGGSLHAADDPNFAREQLNAVVWFQNAPEYKGTTASVYAAATMQLRALRRGTTSASVEQLESGESFRRKPKAVVIDIDETILDNSPYNALLVRDHKKYDEKGYDWTDWVNAREATPIDGSVKFIKEARRLGYTVLFVSNRACKESGTYDGVGESTECPQERATHDNLKKVLGYDPPDADVYLRFEQQGRADKDKQDRRREIAARYRIALLVGDDINDFIRAADYQEATHAKHWSVDWFALPNPMYGTWDRKYATLNDRYAALRVWNRLGSETAAPAVPTASRSRAPLPRMQVHLQSKAADAAGLLAPVARTGPSRKELRNAVTPDRGLARTALTSAAQPLDAVLRTASPPDNLRVHFIPVGAGSCQIIECPGSPDVIINDCGKRGTTSPGAWDVNSIKSYVASLVGNDHPAVVISHPHSDHYGYISKIPDPKTVEVALFGGSYDKFPQNMTAWLEAVPGGRVRYDWEPGYHEEVPELACGGAKVHMATVNIPSEENKKHENANSLVLAVKYGDHVAVFPGDAEGSTQQSALANYPELLQKVTLIAAPHHGSKYHGSNDAAWTQVVSPNIVVYSAGVIDGHPRAESVANYQHNLFDAAPHSMWISPRYSDSQTYDSEQAEYTTEGNGLIIFESDGTNVGLSCANQDDPCF